MSRSKKKSSKISKYLNRGISTPIAITIIIVLVLIVIGGALGYQYYWGERTDKESLDNGILKKADFSKLNKDELLHKLFPNLYFKDGVADLAASGVTPYSDYPGLKLYLKDSVEDYFINNQEKNLLLIVKLDGVAHAGGLYHAYLGLFDKDGNLLTPSSNFPKPNIDTVANYVFNSDKTQFGADIGEFGFYNCKGVKYIAFASHGCPNGSCCFGTVGLFRINNGEFEEIQTIDDRSLANNNLNLQSFIFSSVEAAGGPAYGLKMTLSDTKIIVKKVPAMIGPMGNTCPETDYRVLDWNENSCRFE